MQCSSMHGIYAQLTGDDLYICSVVLYKASMMH